MIEATPSRTALSTSLMRALHARRDPAPLLDDPWGDRLVPEVFRDGFRKRILARMDSEARAAALRRDGYATVAALSPQREDAVEAARLGCTHVLRDGEVWPLVNETQTGD